MGWQKMETAPRDGSEVLVAAPDGIYIASWQDREDDAPDQPGHNEGWASTCWSSIWPGRDQSGGFSTGSASYIHEPVNQPLRWQPIDVYPDDIDWETEAAQ